MSSLFTSLYMRGTKQIAQRTLDETKGTRHGDVPTLMRQGEEISGRALAAPSCRDTEQDISAIDQ